MSLFEQQEARQQSSIGQDHFQHWHATDGEIIALFYRIADGYLIRFPDRADFTIALDGPKVSCVPVPGISQQIITAIYYNQILPLLRSHEGELILHASAVSGPAGALAFLGPSGHGKSTLAAGFARAGHPFLTDDGLWLEHGGASYTALPNRPGIRLWPDSEAAIIEGEAIEPLQGWYEKSYLDSGPALPFRGEPLRLQAVYLLGPGTSETVCIDRLDRPQALSELIKQSFILDVEDRKRLHAHFDRVVRLAETITCFTLDYPRRYEELPGVIDAILAHASSGDPAA